MCRDLKEEDKLMVNNMRVMYRRKGKEDFRIVFLKLYIFFGKRLCCWTHSQDGYEVEKLEI
jgi:hypothetical protein